MNDAQARRRNLPGSDVYRRDQICYVNDVNRKGASGRLLRAGYIMFFNTPIVRHYKDGAPLDFFTWFFNNEYIIDLVRIQVCYEHYLKARFLLAGFVIHEFKKSAQAKKLFRTLHNPKTKLVKIEDLRQDTEFIFHPEEQYNEIEELSDRTLGFSELIKHRTIHSIPENVERILKKHSKHRNMLHYTEAQPRDFDPADIEEVVTHVGATVPP
jgi:hypothetical protein